MIIKEKDKAQFWLTLCILLPVLVLGRLGTYFTDNTLYSILLAGVLGGMGGLLGGGVYHIIKNKTLVFKILGVLILLLFCAGILFFGLSLKH